MALNGEVTKTLVILRPGLVNNATRDAVRTILIENGFVIVREESREITQDIAAKLVAYDDEVPPLQLPVEARKLVGNVHVYIAARTEAAATLNKYLSEKESARDMFFWSPKQSVASRQMLLLFPRMSADPIPTNAEAREFVNTELKAILVQGLTAVAKNKPENSVKFLAEYLLEHNPRRPPTVQ